MNLGKEFGIAYALSLSFPPTSGGSTLNPEAYLEASVMTLFSSNRALPSCHLYSLIDHFCIYIHYLTLLKLVL
jgi:hypothetical protein